MSHRADGVSLREITDVNRPDIERLSVTPDQSNYVAGNTESLREAAETPGACPWFRGVYAGDTPVGFVMISDGIPDGHPEYLGPYFLWRLMIDTQFQGQGYGAATLDLVVDYLRTRPNADKLVTSLCPGTIGSPRGFYLRYGFTLTGEWSDGEEVMELPLPSEAAGKTPVEI